MGIRSIRREKIKSNIQAQKQKDLGEITGTFVFNEVFKTCNSCQNFVKHLSDDINNIYKCHCKIKAFKYVYCRILKDEQNNDILDKRIVSVDLKCKCENLMDIIINI